MQSLQNKVAIVTGASRGIGKAVAEKLASAGAHVYLNFRSNTSEAENVRDSIRSSGGSAELLQFDIADSSAVSDALEGVLKETKQVDILVNNAGISKDGLFVRLKDEDWFQTINTNLSGAFYTSRVCAKYMMKARSGRIINMSSVVGQMGNPGQAPYVASKAGLIGLTKSLAKELAPRGITVNAIAPGFIETEMTGALDPETKQKYLNEIPLGSFGSVDQIAESVLFLSSPGASYITGQVLAVNGGLYM